MHLEPTCPRCGDAVRAPGLWSSGWQCAVHGEVPPYHVMVNTGPDAISHVVGQATVPVWLARGLPGGWLCSGVAYAGDERTGACATVVGHTGPSPLGGAAEVIVVAEEPMVGLGARHAGLTAADPGLDVGSRRPESRISVGGHDTPLWSVPTVDDRAAFAGEAKGLWLWLVVHPAAAGVLVYDDVALVDLREAPTGDLEFGSLSARLSGRLAS